MSNSNQLPRAPGRFETLMLSVARIFWPELASMTGQRQLLGMGDVLIFLFALPLALVGLAWLVMETDLAVLRANLWVMLLAAALVYLFSRISYFIIVELRTDRYGSADGSLATMVQWWAVFLVGPSALWLLVVSSLLNFIWNFRKLNSPTARWARWRGVALEIAGSTLAYLLALQYYESRGGGYPLVSLRLTNLTLPLSALLIHAVILVLLWMGYMLFAIWTQRVLNPEMPAWPIVRFTLLALGLPVLSHPFAVLAAGLYIQNGFGVFMFFIVGLLLVAYLSRQLSWAAESSRQQSRQLQRLEQLGRALINAPLDASGLAVTLEEHVPPMFPSARIVIWLEPNEVLLKNPPDWNIDLQRLWPWLSQQEQAHAFTGNMDLPWARSHTLGNANTHDPVLVAVIRDVEDQRAIGGVYMELRSLAQPWDMHALKSLFPAANTLAAQVASALHQALVYEESLNYERVSQELAFAGRIQASFLPVEMPHLNGWELAVTLLPARETSGDYFDFIPLTEGRIGILIADVADKGVGAALYMALSRTLIRTYALEYDAQPDVVFFASNERILEDAHANLFVTAFYGILDQASGELTYANAGHNPPYLFSPKNGDSVQALAPTGMPMGIQEDTVWTQGTVKIEPGDVLVLYTDGIPDAQNSAGHFYKEKQLVEVARQNVHLPAQEIQTVIIDSVQEFSGSAAQFDDITLLVLRRENE